MNKKAFFSFFVLFFLILVFQSPNSVQNAKAAGNPRPSPLPLAPLSAPLPQSSGVDPQCRQDACTGACTMETLFWGSLSTFNTYLDVITPLTGCNQSELKAALDAALDVASELASVETGAFLSCGNVWAGVESVCEDACEANPCRYAPNLRAEITNSDPFADRLVQVSLSNGVSGDGLDGSAITGGVDLAASLQYQGWEEPVPFAWYQLPSLGYPGLGWSTAAAAGCTDDSVRCDFLSALANVPLSRDVSIGLPQGGVYNLASLVSSSDGVDSDLSSGVAILLNDDDSLTLASGLNGVTFVREDFDWDGRWDNQYVESWNSWGGEVTVSNTECHYFCWLGRQKVNRDKFVLVLEGPCDSLLLGDYSLRVEAPLDHDRNTANNSDEISYAVDSIPADCGVDLDSASIAATLTPGDYNLSFNNEFIQYYRVVVPADAALLEVILEGPDSNDPNDNLDLLLRQGQVPETHRQGFVAYDYAAEDLVGYPDRLRVPVPEPGDWFIEVYHRGLLYSHDYQLTINIETSGTPILDLTEGQYTLEMARGHSSQVFRLHYPSQLESMLVSFEPPRVLGLVPNSNYQIYMCPQVVPHINYEHAVTPGFVCDVGGRVTFAGQGLFGWPINAQVASPGGRDYYLLVERTSGNSLVDYNLNITFTWPAGVGEESEANDSCENANSWPPSEIFIPKRGYFYRAGASGDSDAYSLLIPGGGESTEMETYLASVPPNVVPDLVVYQKTGSGYQELAADRSAVAGGSPRVRFDLVYGQEYCFLVTSRNQAQSQSDPYSLYLDYAQDLGTDETEVEPNDIAAEATQWTSMDNAMRGRLSPLNDRDYFKWTAARSGVFFVAVDPTPTIPTHRLLVFEQTGEDADTHTPSLTDVNQGFNLSEIYPVGLTFYATQGTNYYFEMLPYAAVETDWYKLTLAYLGDYGQTCTGAAFLKIGRPNPSSGLLSNAVSSQLDSGDKDCFRLHPEQAGTYTLVLPQSPAGTSSLVELFRYNPNAFNFDNETRTPLGQLTFPPGSGSNGAYTLGFTPDTSAQGLSYAFPGYTPNVDLCACISAATPGDTSGQDSGDDSSGAQDSGVQGGQDGSGGGADAVVTACSQAPLIVMNRNNPETIAAPGEQDYFRIELENGQQHRVALMSDPAFPVRVEVIENGVVIASTDTLNKARNTAYVEFIPTTASTCMRVSAVDSTATSDQVYNVKVYLYAK